MPALNLKRNSNLEALLITAAGTSHGEINDGESAACDSCKNPATDKKFLQYVSIPGTADNACGNCRYNSNGNKCSFSTAGFTKRTRSSKAAEEATPTKSGRAAKAVK